MVCSLFKDLISKIWESRADSPALGRLEGDDGEQVFCSQGSPPPLCLLWPFGTVKPKCFKLARV